MDKVVEFCQESKFKVNIALGIMGRKFFGTTGDNYNYKMSKMFDQIAQGIDPFQELNNEVPVDKGLALQQQTEIGDLKYANICRLLADNCKMPQKNKIRKRKHQLVPKYENVFNQGNIMFLFHFGNFFKILESIILKSLLIYPLDRLKPNT